MLPDSVSFEDFFSFLFQFTLAGGVFVRFPPSLSLIRGGYWQWGSALLNVAVNSQRDLVLGMVGEDFL